ncbi:MAG: glycosyltransferase [Myxococcota bacterium]
MLDRRARPRVSVLLPVRDAAATLGACLRSVARQTEPDLECIVVDDASRDASRDVAHRAARADARFRVVDGPGRGIAAALEAGLAHCRADVVARMDADDWMHRDRLRAQCDALDADASLDGVGCHVRIFPRGALADGRLRYERWLASLRTPDDVARDAFVECPLAHPTWALRRATFERFPYRDVPFPEDYDLLLRALGAGARLGVVPRRLVGWRDGPARLSRTDARYAIAAFTECKAWHLARGFLAGGDDYVLWGHGATGRALARALARHGKHPSAIVELHPRRIGREIAGAPVVPPEALGPGGALEARARAGALRLVASVAGARPRAEIRAALARLGLRDGADFVCAA